MSASATFATVELEVPKDLTVFGLDVAPDGRSFATTGAPMNKPARVALWDATAATCRLPITCKEKGDSNSLRFSRDGRRLAVALGKVIGIMDAVTLDRIVDLPLKQNTITQAIDWSESGDQLLTGTFWGVADYWDVAARKLRTSVSTSRIELVAFLPDQSHILLATQSGISLWDPESGALESRLSLPGKLNQSKDWAYTLSSDRSFLIAVSDHDDVCRIDTRSWKSQTWSVGRKKKVQSAALAPDNSKLAIGYVDGTVLIWDMSEKRVWFRHREEHLLDPRVAFLDDCQRLLCVYDCNNFRIRDFRSGALGKELPKAELPTGTFNCTHMVGSDNRMDQRGNLNLPVNPLPVKCAKCQFPDLDHVPQPYFLAKGTSQPNELAPAEVGNFLVRERAKDVLETILPGLCLFYPTQDVKTKQPTPWFLAVPVQLVPVNEVQKRVPRCPNCNEPMSAHPGSQYEGGYRTSGAFAFDVCKSLNWGSLEQRREIFRDVFFSVRLETLFKRLKVCGLNRSCFYKQKATPEDLAWVEEQVKKLAQAAPAPRKASKGRLATPDETATQEWLAAFLNKHSAKSTKRLDIEAVEKKHDIKLPEPYKEFIRRSSKRVFHDVDTMEGFTVRILPPDKIDFAEYRQAGEAALDPAEGEIDGVMFAITDHGDVFCFNLAEAKGSDYAVYHYQHEMEFFEPYAPNFIACLKRFNGDM